jgi:hypothetical protein
MKTETTTTGGNMSATMWVHYCHCADKKDWLDKLIIKTKNYVTKTKKKR